MLDHVGHQLIDDQGQWNRHVGRHLDRVDISSNAVRTAEPASDFLAKVAEKCLQRDDLDVVAGIETLVHGGDRKHTRGRIAHSLGRLGIFV